MAIGVVGHDGVHLAPRQQRVEYWNERPSGFGEPIFVTHRSALVRRTGDDARTLQGLEARRDAVARRAGAPHDVAEVGRPEGDLSDNEQSPAFADEIQRRGDRAGPPGRLAKGMTDMATSLPAVSLKIKLSQS